MELNVVKVEQGNGKGQYIDKDSDAVLRTTDLVGCIAVLIVGKERCCMIHSDVNNTHGIGAISLGDGIKLVVTDLNEHYEIGLIGGASPESLNAKYKEIQRVLPQTCLKMAHIGVDSAYLDSHGNMAHTKVSLAKKLGIVSSDLELTTPNHRHHI